jgi:hypothetical protein
LSKVTDFAPHATVLTEANHETLYHYGSPIARRYDDGKVLLHPDYWDYSQTTHKVRGRFLGENTTTTRKHIEDGTYEIREF